MGASWKLKAYALAQGALDDAEDEVRVLMHAGWEPFAAHPGPSGLTILHLKKDVSQVAAGECEDCGRNPQSSDDPHHNPGCPAAGKDQPETPESDGQVTGAEESAGAGESAGV